jgi:ABC-type transporter Mla subunit MlaD
MTEAGARDVAQVSDEDATAFRARREALHAAVTDLDQHLDALDAQDVPDAVRFRDALDELLVTLQRHVEEADAPDGLLAQILEEASYFASRVDRLRGEHGDLLGRAADLRDRARSSDDVRPLLPDARQLSARVAEHRQRGTELLVDATMLDLSAGD